MATQTELDEEEQRLLERANAIAATIGRNKYGKAKFQKMAASGNGK